MSDETNRVCSPLSNPWQVVACEEVARICEGKPNGDDGGYVLQFQGGTARPPDRESCYQVARSAGRSEWKLLPRGSQGVLAPSAPNASDGAVITLTSVEQAKREILSSPEPVWVIIGTSYCEPCHLMRDRMAKANRAGGMKAKVAYIDYNLGEGSEIIIALGLRELLETKKGIPKLFYLGRGKGKAKPRKGIHEIYPERFKGIDIKRDKPTYHDRFWEIWPEIIDRIAAGGNGR